MSLSDFEWENMMGLDEVSVDDEIKGTAEHFVSDRTAKTEEEINKLCSKDGLNEIERISFILRNGIPIQKASLLGTFENLAKNDLFKDAFQSKIIPICLDIIFTEPIPFQIKLGHILLNLIPSLPPNQARPIFVVSKSLSIHKIEEMEKVWKNVFLACIAKIPEDDIKKEIIPEAVIDGGLSQPVRQRIWCGRVLGASSSRIDPKRIEQQVFPKLSQLAQDTDQEVRKIMCKEIGSVIKVIGLKTAKKTIMPEFLDLLNDEEGNVQQAALEALMDFSDIFDAESRNSIFIPAWKKIVSSGNSKILIPSSAMFGTFLWKVKNELNDNEKHVFISYYETICTSTEVACRRNAIYCFPAIINIVKPANFTNFKLEKALKAFSMDEDVQVQYTLAAMFHEVAVLLGANAFKHLSDPLANFLKSEDEIILGHIYNRFDLILQAFNQEEQSQKQAAYMETVFYTILETRKMFEANPNMGWRLHEKILRTYEILPTIYETDMVYDNCIPSLFKLVLEPCPSPIKRQTIRVLVVFLRKLKKSSQNESILKFLLDIKDEKSYHVRILYFDICEEIMAHFSQKFFRSYFFYGYLGLSRDLVSNVRVRFISILPLVRHCLRPSDNALLGKLIDSCESLSVRDSSPGVMLAMNQFHAKYGLLHHAECCQKVIVEVQKDDFGFDSDDTALLKRDDSLDSLTDKYLIGQPTWESLPKHEEDRLREESEQRLLYFQLDPAKKKEAINNALTKGLRKMESFSAGKKTAPPSASQNRGKSSPMRRPSSEKQGAGSLIPKPSNLAKKPSQNDTDLPELFEGMSATALDSVLQVRRRSNSFQEEVKALELETKRRLSNSNQLPPRPTLPIIEKTSSQGPLQTKKEKQK